MNRDPSISAGDTVRFVKAPPGCLPSIVGKLGTVMRLASMSSHFMYVHVKDRPNHSVFAYPSDVRLVSRHRQPWNQEAI